MRAFITTADIRIIMGKSLRDAQYKMQALRTSLRRDSITFSDFSREYAIDEAIIKAIVPDALFLPQHTQKAQRAQPAK